MNIKDLTAYELLKQEELDGIKSSGYVLRHKKSGARITLISNDDDNKVFTIGFRTPPEDSTGLPHILEHSVLCGSKKYPAKDPFVELAKGSLNTFLNAMTFPDKTVYPVASCNDKDFQNLMNIYMDAVFYPNIYEKEEIFRQEGWHYELEEAKGKLTYNGVVYNEMKGAFSSPESMLYREILNSLFPDNAYGYESGGDPKVIPELTYSQFLSFHKKYYHPSNSYIYLYGNIDMAEKLSWLDQAYLSKYDAVLVDSGIEVQSSFVSMREVTKPYSITEEEPLEDNTYLSYNKVVATSLDRELYYAFQVLEYALLSAPGAPLKKALLDAKIGKDIMGFYDNGVLQPYFSVIAKNSNRARQQDFVQVITDTLSRLVEKGIDRKALEAGINYFEFRFREADFGNYPKGLMYGLQMFDSWLYQESEPFLHLDALEIFKVLKEKLDTGYFETLVQTYLLDNQHGCYVILEPERGLTARQDKAVEQKLAAYKQSLSEAEIQKLVDDTKALKKYQEEPSTPEELAAIPVLSVSDIKKEAAPVYNKEYKTDNTLVLHHNIFTNGIGYLNLMFDTAGVPERLIPYIGILKMVLGYVDTKNYTYGDLFNEINRNSGGISTQYYIYSNLKKPGKYRTLLAFQAKILYDKLPFAFDMIREIICSSKIEDEKRLYEIIAETKSRLQMAIQASGHSAALNRAMSYFSPTAYLTDLTDGIEFYYLVKSIEEDFDGRKSELIANLRELLHYTFREENLMVDYIAEEKGCQNLENEIIQFKKVLYQEPIKKEVLHLNLQKKNEGFRTASQVQYVARCGNFAEKGLAYTGALRVLKVMMSYDYLWNQIRVMGGAYGCMNGFGKNGDSFFVSYRDPNLERTNEIYQKAPEYIRNCNLEEKALTKFIIGAISNLDTPLNPLAEGKRSLAVYMQKQTFEELQRERDEVLQATEEDIHKLADIVQALLSSECICVIGNEEKLQSQREMFMNIKTI